eukprot:jgi/Psemu1/30666/gm1.30666_g
MADTKPSAINQEAPKGNDTTGSGNTNNSNNGQSAKKKTNWNKNKRSNGNLNTTTSKKKSALNYIGKKYTMSKVTSLKNAKMTVVGMTHPEKHTEDEFKKLLFWEKEIEAKSIVMLCHHLGTTDNDPQEQDAAEHDIMLIAQSKDSIKLYELLGQVCSQISTSDHYPTSVIDTIFGIMNLSGNSMTLLDYLEHFNKRRKCLKHIGFHFRCDAYTLLVNYEGSEMFIQNQLKPGRGKNQNGHNNQSANPRIKLRTIREDHQPRQAKFPLGAASAATAPDGEQHDKIQQKLKRIVCYQCDCDNHISPECPYTTKKDEDNANSGTALVQSSDDFDFKDELDQDDYATAYAFIQRSLPDMCTAGMTRNHRYCMNTKHVRGRLDDFWILLDNQSTVHIFCNEMFFLIVCKTPKKLELHTNAGSIIIDKIGELPGVGTIWLHREGIANILSFGLIQDINQFSVKYLSVAGPSWTNRKAFHVEAPNQIKHIFKSDGRGLYYLDSRQYFGAGKPNDVFGDNIINTESSLTALSIKPVSFQERHIKTVEGNKAQFTKRDVLRAEALRCFQHIAGQPSDKTLVDMTTKHVIKNSLFIPHDVQIAVVKAYGIRGFTVKAILLDLQFDGLQTKPDVSNERSPTTIIKGIVLYHEIHFPVIFGEYAQTYEGTDNTMKEQTVGAIALGLTGSLQGLQNPTHASRCHQTCRTPSTLSHTGLIFGDRNNTIYNTEDDKDDDDDSDDNFLPTDTTTDIPVEDDDSALVTPDSNDDSTGVNTKNFDITGVDNQNVQTTGVDKQDPDLLGKNPEPPAAINDEDEDDPHDDDYYPI